MDDPSQLWLDLAVTLMIEGLKTETEPQEPWPVPHRPAPHQLGNGYTWSDQDIIKVADGLLKTTVRALFDGRHGEDMRETAWAWVLAPAPQEGARVSMSFWACCQLIGVDHETMRELLVNEKTRRERQKKKAAQAA